MVENCINGKKIFNGYDQKYSVFSDMLFLNENIHIEGNHFFKIIDRDYPNSLFIYNYRNMDNWINSRLSHGVNSQNPSFIDRSLKVYSEDTEMIKKRWQQTRLTFEKEISLYFSGSNKLLLLDIEDGNVNHPEIISKFVGYQMNPKYWGWLGKKGEPSIRRNAFVVIVKRFLNFFKKTEN